MRTIRLGHAVVRIDHSARWMETVYEDGTRAPATPQDTDEYRATTARLGYGTDTWRQCVEHEVLHTWVALKMGRPHSTILWNVAHGGAKRWPPGGREEEAHAMGLQRFLNTGEVDEPTQELFGMCARLWRQTAADGGRRGSPGAATAGRGGRTSRECYARGRRNSQGDINRATFRDQQPGAERGR